MWREDSEFSFFHAELQLDTEFGSISNSFKYKHLDSRTDPRESCAH